MIQLRTLVKAERDGYVRACSPKVAITLRRDEQRTGIVQAKAYGRPDLNPGTANTDSNAADTNHTAMFQNAGAARLVTAERDGYVPACSSNVAITLRRDEQRSGIVQTKANGRPDLKLSAANTDSNAEDQICKRPRAEPPRNAPKRRSTEARRVEAR